MTSTNGPGRRQRWRIRLRFASNLWAMAGPVRLAFGRANTPERRPRQGVGVGADDGGILRQRHQAQFAHLRDPPVVADLPEMVTASASTS